MRFRLELTPAELRAVFTALDATVRAGDMNDALSVYGHPATVDAAFRALNKTSDLLHKEGK